VATALKSCFSGEKGALLEPAFLHELRWNVVATGVVTALVIAACWVPDGDRPASPAGTPSVQRSNVIQQQIPFVPPNSARSNRASKAQTAVGEAEEAKSPSSAFKQLRGRAERNRLHCSGCNNTPFHDQTRTAASTGPVQGSRYRRGCDSALSCVHPTQMMNCLRGESEERIGKSAEE
jgi:hypothetical protein